MLDKCRRSSFGRAQPLIGHLGDDGPSSLGVTDREGTTAWSIPASTMWYETPEAWSLAMNALI